MRIYAVHNIINVDVYVGTRAEARAVLRQVIARDQKAYAHIYDKADVAHMCHIEAMDVPTDKAGLIDWINGHC